MILVAKFEIPAQWDAYINAFEAKIGAARAVVITAS